MALEWITIPPLPFGGIHVAVDHDYEWEQIYVRPRDSQAR